MLSSSVVEHDWLLISDCWLLLDITVEVRAVEAAEGVSRDTLDARDDEPREELGAVLLTEVPPRRP